MPQRNRRSPSLPGVRLAIAAVHHRRSKARPEDPDLDRFPDQDDIWGVIHYIARFQRVPDDLIRQDAVAQILLLDYLADEIDRRRLAAIRLARKRGMTWKLLADPLTVTSAQGAEQAYLRLVNAVEGHGHKDEKEGRRLRSSALPLPAERDQMFRAFIALLIKYRDDLTEGVLETVYELNLPPGEPVKASFGTEVGWLIDALREAGVPDSLRTAVDQVAEYLRARD